MTANHLTRHRKRDIWLLLLATLASLVLIGTARSDENPPGVALYHFRGIQGAESAEQAKNRAEWVSSLLANKLGSRTQIALLDRSNLNAILDEQSLLLGKSLDTQQRTQPTKLPLSKYTITGTVHKGERMQHLSVRLVENSGGQILAMRHGTFQSVLPAEIVDELADWLVDKVLQHAKAGKVDITNASQRIAFGSFECLDDDVECRKQGALFPERLTDAYLDNEKYTVVARTDIVPLVIEDILRSSQYVERVASIKGRDTHNIVYGKLRSAANDVHVSLYLYMEDEVLGRTLRVLTANDWDSLYAQANAAITQHYRLTAAEDPEKQDYDPVAKEDFLSALKILGIISSGTKKLEKLHLYQAKRFQSDYGGSNDKYSKALELLQLSLAKEPDYPPALLAKAGILESKGRLDEAIKVVEKVVSIGDQVVHNTAQQMLREMIAEKYSFKNPWLFDDIAGKGKTKDVIDKLLQDEYLLQNRGEKYPRINHAQKTDAIVNQTHTLTLKGVSPNQTVQVFERLRQMIHHPGEIVRFITPNPYYRSEVSNFYSRWKQRLKRSPYNRDSVIHQELGKNITGITIPQLGKMGAKPTVQQWRHSEVEAIKTSRMAWGLDGLASGAFVDPTNLESLVLLGHALCMEETSTCALGMMVNIWVLNYTHSIYPDRRSSGLINRDPYDDELDALIFLAATRVDGLMQANLTAFTRGMDYYREALASSQSNAVSIDTGESNEIADIELRQTISAYAADISISCVQLKESRRDLRMMRYLRKYTKEMDALADLARKNPKVRPLRTRQLAMVESKCKEVYPYLVVAMDAGAEFLTREQDEMIWKILSRKSVPALITQFVELSFTLFESRVNSGDMDAAKEYIRNYVDFFGINDSNAHDFAYLYHRINDDVTAQKILNSFGLNRLELSNYQVTAINGSYVADGFDDQNRLRYRSNTNDRSVLYYRGEYIRYGTGDKPVKWSVIIDSDSTKPSSKVRRFNGNSNPKQPGKFCFGNGGAVVGDIIWPLRTDKLEHESKIKQARDVPPTISAEPTITQLHKMAAVDMGKGDMQMLQNGFLISESGKYAIKGASDGYASGPLLPSLFPREFSANHDVNSLIEALFDKGHLTVSGIPNIKPSYKVHDIFKRDFPGLSEYERRVLKEAYFTAGKLFGAGYAEIYRKEGGVWHMQATLSASDAAKQNSFGHSVFVSDDYAFVCDYRNSLYIFSRDSEDWVEQQHINTPCWNVVGNSKWVIVKARAKVVVFANERGNWYKHQELIPHDYLQRENDGRHFENFGNAMVLKDDRLFVGDKAYVNGDITQYHLSEGQWLESGIISSPPEYRDFPRSLAWGNGCLAVGVIRRSSENTGSAFLGKMIIYHNTGNAWHPAVLVEPDEKTVDFASSIWFSQEQDPTFGIKSKKELFQYHLGRNLDFQSISCAYKGDSNIQNSLSVVE